MSVLFPHIVSLQCLPQNVKNIPHIKQRNEHDLPSLTYLCLGSSGSAYSGNIFKGDEEEVRRQKAIIEYLGKHY